MVLKVMVCEAGGVSKMVTVAGSLVITPLVTTNEKLSEPDSSAGGVYVALPVEAFTLPRAPSAGGSTI